VRTRPSSPILSRAATAFVKVGGGFYSDFEHPELLGMRRMRLLEALQESKGFGASLKGVMLDKCAVLVHPTPIANEEPTPAEKAARKPLTGMNTIGFLASGVPTPFIRVKLPPTAGSAGTCPCSPLTRSPPVMR